MRDGGASAQSEACEGEVRRDVARVAGAELSRPSRAIFVMDLGLILLYAMLAAGVMFIVVAVCALLRRR
jgi:hypothetical protein